jgi:putative transposase
MSHTYTSLFTHLIFSTKDRAALIVPDIQDELHAYMAGIIRNQDGLAVAINGPADRVHGLVITPPTLCLCDLLRTLKSGSSGWIHERWPRRGDVAWQTGYGAFSVSASKVPDVKVYIAGQEEHHRKVTFKEEFVAFLERHGVEYDEGLPRLTPWANLWRRSAADAGLNLSDPHRSRRPPTYPRKSSLARPYFFMRS